MAQEDKVWWYATGDQKCGPYSARELKAAAVSGKFVSTDLVWKNGLAKWVPASSIKGLISPAPANMPPPLPATQINPAPLSQTARTADAIIESVQKELQRFVIGDLSGQISKWINKMLNKTFALSAIGVVTIVVLGLIFISGKSPVACNDSDAKKLVMEITEQEIKNQLAQRTSNVPVTYDALVKLVNSNKLYEKAVDEIDKQYTDANPTLSSIRTESLDNKLIKTECAADIEFENGNKTPITYQLSVTSEGELYAEVFGL